MAELSGGPLIHKGVCRKTFSWGGGGAQGNFCFYSRFVTSEVRLVRTVDFPFPKHFPEKLLHRKKRPYSVLQNLHIHSFFARCRLLFLSKGTSYVASN